MTKTFFIRVVVAPALALGALASADPAVAVMDYVKVCDDFGAHYIYIPGTSTCLNVDTGETREVTVDGTVSGSSTLKQQADAAEAGAAVAISLPNATIDEGKTFGLSANYGAYGDAGALGVSGAFRAADGLTINAGAGVSTTGGTAGGRVGVNFSW